MLRIDRKRGLNIIDFLKTQLKKLYISKNEQNYICHKFSNDFNGHKTKLDNISP